eukprot:CAMPEP_0169089878 /NCGR_PEP_ID=MMETSP1015-20121227/15524_1 /TAXON_ID=342587 /ORGANISM="Karlodinium micrum, Strain CCMP2283" /LENGTH=77 /DNA_ID=CAMNT_0009150253 /DNA_START=34 /DNA_END=267 /DNA_ORIENTATION=+
MNATIAKGTPPFALAEPPRSANRVKGMFARQSDHTCIWLVLFQTDDTFRSSTIACISMGEAINGALQGHVATQRKLS